MSGTNIPKQMPIQNLDKLGRERLTVPEPVYMAAYEVYCHYWRPQEALVTGGCRGGFAINELVAFLYAKQFPKEQWKEKVREAWEGMNL